MLSDGKYQRPVLSPNHSIFLHPLWFENDCLPFEKTPNDPNETFTQWKIEKASSQLACIKIPHHPSSFSQTYVVVVVVGN